jgi:hypothetical protein
MKNDLEGAEQAQPGEVAHRPTRTVEDIVASRAVATERVFKGGVLAVLGFGGALLIDFLNLGPGLPFWISISAALSAFGTGAVWAGSGASLDSTWEKGLFTLAHLSGRTWWFGGLERGERHPGEDLGPSVSGGPVPVRDGLLWALHRCPHRHWAHHDTALDPTRLGSNGWGYCIGVIRDRVNEEGTTTSTQPAFPDVRRHFGVDKRREVGPFQAPMGRRKRGGTLTEER